MKDEESALDDPIWSILNGSQAPNAIGTDFAKRYQHDISILASFANLASPDWKALANVTRLGEHLLTITVPVPEDSGFKVLFSGPGRQYVYRSKNPPPIQNNIEASALTQADIPEMVRLTTETQMGEILKAAFKMGRFMGIRSGNRLVAMASERTPIGQFREIGDVCTAPDHTGRGLATYLVSRLANDIIERGDVPILHVADNNARAISVYERIGFEFRMSYNIQVVEYIGLQ